MIFNFSIAQIENCLEKSDYSHNYNVKKRQYYNILILSFLPIEQYFFSLLNIVYKPVL